MVHTRESVLWTESIGLHTVKTKMFSFRMGTEERAELVYGLAAGKEHPVRHTAIASEHTFDSEPFCESFRLKFSEITLPAKMQSYQQI